MNDDLDTTPAPQEPIGDSVPVNVVAPTPVSPALTPIAPVAEPAAVPVAPVVIEKPVNTPGAIILQWLTYAFWSWTILGIGYLVATIANYTLNSTFATTSPQAIAYGIAATLILLPISFVCDLFYSKQEPEHKHGAAMVVMVIHAVLFALLAIGSLVAIAFSFVNIMLTTGESTGAMIVIWTASAMLVLYVLTLVRTARPLVIKKFRTFFRFGFAALAIGISIWGIVGPVAEKVRTKDDVAVQTGVKLVQSGVETYVRSKALLPTDASVAVKAGYYGDEDTVKSLISRGLITYTPNTKAPLTVLSSEESNYATTTFYYELCATYKHDVKEDDMYYGSYSSYDTPDTDGYSESIDDPTPSAGKTCYKLKVTKNLSSY